MDRVLDACEARLINDFQRAFPLTHAPYAEIAGRLDVAEPWVRERLARWQLDGRVSRVGAVFRPRAIGASTLATLAVGADDLDRVAAIVSARPEVNHNYEREHRFNLWFVANAADDAALQAVLDSIRRETGCAVLSFPLVGDYWIDLGFDLEQRDGAGPVAVPRIPDGRRSTAVELSDTDRRVIAALEDGLPLVSAPYAAIASRVGVSEVEVLDRLARWLDLGVVRRLGVIVRHRELGYAANAMCVWDVPDDDVDRVGETLARETGVTLCYRRRRGPPDWPYNLYCMVHGRTRAQVELAVADIAAWRGLDRYASAMLFSRRRFKQCGARHFVASPT